MNNTILYLIYIINPCIYVFQHKQILAACNRLTSLYRPHILRCVIWDNVDMVFKVLHQLIELLFSAATLCVYLHFCGDSFWFAWFNVGQIDMLLLQNTQNAFTWEIILKCLTTYYLDLTSLPLFISHSPAEVLTNLKEPKSLHQASNLILQRENYSCFTAVVSRACILLVRFFIYAAKGCPTKLHESVETQKKYIYTEYAYNFRCKKFPNHDVFDNCAWTSNQTKAVFHTCTFRWLKFQDLYSYL